MSYPPPRPSSTPTADGAAPSAESHPTPSSHHGQSPLDWTNFLNFATPPVLGAGPAAPGMRTGPSYGATGGASGSGVGGSTAQNNGNSSTTQQQGQNGQGEERYDFARGIAMNQNAGGNINFQHPFAEQSQANGQGQGQGQSGQGQGQGIYGATNGGQRTSLAPDAANATGNGNNNSGSLNNGKSPAHRSSLPQDASGSGRDMGASVDNGLALDPAAFTRDIRFQVPSFLSSQMGGAPTFPPGGEAWSGYSGPNFFSNDGMSNSLTPGQMFSSMFNAQGQGSGGSQGQSGDGMGYMPYGQTQSWDAWNGDKQDGSGMQGMSGQMGTTYYVNPNAQNMGHRGMGQGFGQNQQRPDASPRSRPPPINVSGTNASPAQMTAPPIPSPRTTNGQFSADQSDPRRRVTAPSNMQPQNGSAPGSSQAQGQGQGQNGSGSMPTSALFPSFSVDAGGFQFNPDSGFTDPSKPIASTINIASSSTAPYAPPSNTQQLLTAPIAPQLAGPSLTEGPGLYSTTGFDMVGVLARVANRKDPKTVLGPVDLSCSFAVVVRFSLSLGGDGHWAMEEHLGCSPSVVVPTILIV